MSIIWKDDVNYEVKHGSSVIFGWELSLEGQLEGWKEFLTLGLIRILTAFPVFLDTAWNLRTNGLVSYLYLFI